jgi:hypothetical protein
MSARTAARIAWPLCGLSAVLGGLSLLLLALNGANSTDEYWGAGLVIAVVFPAVGALIVSHHPANALGWIFCAVGLAGGAGGFAGEYATYALLTEPGSLPGPAAAAWFGTVVGNAGFASLLFVPLLFPDGRPPSRRWWPVVWLTAAVIALQAGGIAFMPGPLSEAHPTVKNPLGIEGAAGIFQALANTLPIAALCLVAAAASLVVRYRRSRGDEREQIKWFTYAIALGLLSLVGNSLFPDLAWLIGGVGTALIPLAIGVAIVGYRLYDIEVIINRTLVYGALTAALAAAYFGGVALLQYALRVLAGGESGLAVVASTLAIAALANPLRRRIQALVDRSFYRKKYDAAQVLSDFGARLREQVDLETLRGDLMAVIEETMRPAHAGLWLAPARGPKTEEERDKE